jgi:hypothetical protein
VKVAMAHVAALGVFVKVECALARLACPCGHRGTHWYT